MERFKLMRLQSIWGNRCNSEPYKKKWLFLPFNQRAVGPSSSSATTLLPGQDNPAPSGPMSRASCVMVSYGVRLSVVWLSEIRKPQVEQVRKPQTGGFAKNTDRRTNCAHFVLNSTSLQLIPAYSSQSSLFALLLAKLGLSEPE